MNFPILFIQEKENYISGKNINLLILCVEK